MSQFFRSLKNEYLPVLLIAVVIGCIVGVVVCLFNKALSFLSSVSVDIYTFVHDNLIYIPLLLLGLGIIGFLMHLVHKKVPGVRGGGMPQTIAMCKGEVSYKWYQVWWANIVCSCMSFFSGLPVGAEGPSMFLGASSAEGLRKTFRFRPYLKKYLSSAGASSGFAATFNAPLAGMLFTIEKVHRKFSPLLLFVVGIAVISSTLTINLLNSLWGGTRLFFEFDGLISIPLQWGGLLVGLGAIVGLCSVLFQLILVKSQKFTDRFVKQIPFSVRLICAFVLVGILGVFFVDVITGGHDLIGKVVGLDFSITMIAILLVIKLFLITICYNSGATGGLFIPSLCLGALVGGLCGHLFISCGMPEDFYTTIVCFAMLGFLTGTTHAPLSSLVLLLEITGFTGNLLSSGIVIIVAFVVALICRRKSLYEEQVERLTKNDGYLEEDNAVTKTVLLRPNSVIIGKRVGDIFLPRSVDISNITREDKKIVSDSETRFKAGDKIQFIYQSKFKDEIEEYLSDISK